MRMSVSTETALMPGSNLSLPEGVRNAGVRDNWWVLLQIPVELRPLRLYVAETFAALMNLLRARST
jgi:hypothetical protein